MQKEEEERDEEWGRETDILPHTGLTLFSKYFISNAITNDKTVVCLVFHHYFLSSYKD